MPTRKIAELPERERCMSRDHDPPSHMVLKPGVYEHVCSKCGRVTRFTIRSTGYLNDADEL